MPYPDVEDPTTVIASMTSLRRSWMVSHGSRSSHGVPEHHSPHVESLLCIKLEGDHHLARLFTVRVGPAILWIPPSGARGPHHLPHAPYSQRRAHHCHHRTRLQDVCGVQTSMELFLYFFTLAHTPSTSLVVGVPPQRQNVGGCSFRMRSNYWAEFFSLGVHDKWDN